MELALLGNSLSWLETAMRTTTMSNILKTMDNKDLLKEVEKQTIRGYVQDQDIYELVSSQDKLFLLSYTEVFGGTWNEGTQYEYFKIAENKIIKDSEWNSVDWWLRTPSEFSNYMFHFVTTEGVDNCYSEQAFKGVVPAFVIG